MTTIRTRPYPDGGAAVTGRAATMPPVTGPGRPGRASRTRLRLAVAAAGGLLAAGMIMLAAVAAAGAAADRAPHGEPALGPARPGTATTLTSRGDPVHGGRRGDLCRYGPPGARRRHGGVHRRHHPGSRVRCPAGRQRWHGHLPGRLPRRGRARDHRRLLREMPGTRPAHRRRSPSRWPTGCRCSVTRPRPAPAGPAISVRVVLLDAAGTNVSGPGITVTVTGVSPSPSPGTAPHGTLTAVNLGLWPCYQLTIDTAGYPAGSYTLSFAAGSDPTTHTAQFVVP